MNTFMKTASLILALGLVSNATIITHVQAAQEGVTEGAAPVKEKKAKHPGRNVYRTKTCMACHGKDGGKAILDYPNLAGQNAKYMVQQINDILSGKRTGRNGESGKPRAEGMRGALVTATGEIRISPEEVNDVADWLSSLPAAAPKAPAEPIAAGRIAAGEKLYKDKKCQTCHGKEGMKPTMTAYPYIAGQKSDYIAIQMVDIRDKVRSNGKSKTMLSFVKKLSDEEIGLIADYLSQVDRSK
jgi:cytochrome c553